MNEYRGIETNLVICMVFLSRIFISLANSRALEQVYTFLIAFGSIMLSFFHSLPRSLNNNKSAHRTTEIAVAVVVWLLLLMDWQWHLKQCSGLRIVCLIACLIDFFCFVLFACLASVFVCLFCFIDLALALAMIDLHCFCI